MNSRDSLHLNSMKYPFIYLITDYNYSLQAQLKITEEALIGGVKVVQMRDKKSNSKVLYHHAKELKVLCDRYNVPLIINDRIDIALAVNASGVHLGQNDLPIAKARQLLGSNKIIGLSARTVEDALKAEKSGADYLGVGALYATSTKNDAQVISHDLFKKITQTVKIPIVGIGGIQEHCIGEIREMGATGIAVVSAIFQSENPRENAKKYMDILKSK